MRGLVGRDADSLAHRADAPCRRQRTLGIYVDRVIGVDRRARRLAAGQLRTPAVPLRFHAHRGGELQPVAAGDHALRSGVYDNVGSSSDGDAGVDIFWKPNGQMQLTATVNPDFGQVESDDLVVNFSATETFISDKRPFFTENQGIFEFTTPSDFSQLLYTRRVGGPADDGEGAGDIVAAFKLNGSLGATKYGLFGADEADRAAERSPPRAGARLQQAESRPHGDLGGPALARAEGDASSASITTGGRRRAGMCVRAVRQRHRSNRATAAATPAPRCGRTTRWTTAGVSS